MNEIRDQRSTPAARPDLRGVGATVHRTTTVAACRKTHPRARQLSVPGRVGPMGLFFTDPLSGLCVAELQRSKCGSYRTVRSRAAVAVRKPAQQRRWLNVLQGSPESHILHSEPFPVTAPPGE